MKEPKKYIQISEEYEYEPWGVSSAEAIELLVREGREPLPKKEVLDLSRKIVSKVGLRDKIKVTWAPKLFLEDLPHADAGTIRRAGGYVIYLAPDVRYLPTQEIQEIILHELSHIKAGEVE